MIDIKIEDIYGFFDEDPDHELNLNKYSPNHVWRSGPDEARYTWVKYSGGLARQKDSNKNRVTECQFKLIVILDEKTIELLSFRCTRKDLGAIRKILRKDAEALLCIKHENQAIAKLAKTKITNFPGIKIRLDIKTKKHYEKEYEKYKTKALDVLSGFKNPISRDLLEQLLFDKQKMLDEWTNGLNDPFAPPKI